MTFSLLKFPASIYATALELAYGKAEFTGYGLIENNGVQESDACDSLPLAQRKLAAALSARLPSAPASILEVGCGLGTLAKELTASGYEVTALSDDAAEIARLQDASGANLTAICCRFEAFRGDQIYDVILLQNSAHYLKSLPLLAKARELLLPNGRLLLADEFINKDDEIFSDPRPVLQYFLQLAERLSFNLLRQTNYTLQATGCIEPMQQLLTDFRPALLQKCGVSDSELDGLSLSLATTRQRFLNNKLTYTLLEFSRENQISADSAANDNPLADREVYGDIHSFHPDEVSALFEQSFGNPFDADVWQWKYGDGRGRAVCIRQRGVVVAHYGGAPRDILYFGNEHKAIQICDVMVQPDKRGFYSKSGLFFRTAATFLEQQVGNTAEHLLGIGFPNIKAMKVAVRLGLYEKTDDFIEVDYQAPATNNGSKDDVLCVDKVNEHDPALQEAVNALWLSVSKHFTDAIIGVRDWHYLSYRYFKHPRQIARQHYNCYRVSDATGKHIVGLVIACQHAEATLIMDILALPDCVPRVISSVHAYLNESAGHHTKLVCWISKAKCHIVQTDNCLVNDLRIEIPCNRWTHGPATSTIAGNWWLTAGDMDFM